MTADTSQPATLTPEQMARTAWADILARISECPVGWPESGQPLADIIANAVRSAVMAEREACARTAETTTANGDGSGLWPYGYGMAQAEIAEAIRARSTETAQ